MGELGSSRELNGLPIISLAGGKKIAEIKGVLYDPNCGRLLGLVALFGNRERFVPFENISAFGRDAVITYDDTSLSLLREKRTANAPVHGAEIYDEQGNYLGVVDDLVLNFTKGLIAGFLVSGGMLADITRGKQYLAKRDVIREGSELLVAKQGKIRRMNEFDNEGGKGGF